MSFIDEPTMFMIQERRIARTYTTLCLICRLPNPYLSPVASLLYTFLSETDLQQSALTSAVVDRDTFRCRRRCHILLLCGTLRFHQFRLERFHSSDC